MPAEPPTAWAVQDWLIVVEGLADRFHPDDEGREARRGWHLLETICRNCEIDPAEYVFAIDDDWGAQAAAADSDARPTMHPGDGFDDSDWQLVADALAAVAARERATSRTRRAEGLAAAVAAHEPSVSVRPVES